MTTGPPISERYYYADGRKVPLLLHDQFVSVDQSEVERSGLSKALVQSMQAQAQSLRSGVSLLDRSVMSESLRGELEKRGLLHSVYTADNAVMVPLPEVRVEESRAEAKQAVEEWLAEHANEAVYEQQRRGRIVVKPSSGNPDEALQIANAIHEAVGPELAQVRFLRVVPRNRTAS